MMTASIDYIYEVSGSTFILPIGDTEAKKKKKWRTIPKVKSLVNEKPLESK